MRHAFFKARTVLVQNNNIEEACRLLNRVLGKEEIFDQYRRTRYYEKPYQVGFYLCKRMSLTLFLPLLLKLVSLVLGEKTCEFREV